MHRLRRAIARAAGRRRRSGERGVALLMVLGLLALVGSVVADFQFSARVDLQLAFNARDELQAEYNALSALRMRALILKQARKVAALVQSFAGAGMPLPPIGQILELIPVECGLMSAITKSADAGIDVAAEGGGRPRPGGHDDEHQDFFPGECLATSSSEHSKVAINLLRSNIDRRGQLVAALLYARLSDPALRKHYEEDDRNGQHAETPLILVNAITDYVDADHSEQGNLGDEDRLYTMLADSYRAKNAPLDSVAELQLVYGIDDGLYDLLKDDISVYNGSPALEVSTTPTERLVLMGVPSVLRDGTPLEALLPVLPQLAQRINVMRSLGGGLVPFNTTTLKGVLNDVGLGSLVDDTKFSSVFSDQSSTTWYTIEAEGRMGNASRKLRAVFQATEGTFYYVRME